MSSSSVTQETQHEKFRKMRVNDNVYQLYPDRNEERVQAAAADVDVILFHGFQMPGQESRDAYWRTWKMRKSEDFWPETLLPELLNRDGRTVRARVLSISYEGRLDKGEGEAANSKKAKSGAEVEPAGDSDGYRLVENLIKNLIFDEDVNAGQDAPVVLLGHDLGGILIKLFVIGVENKEATASDAPQSSKTPSDRAKLHKFLENLKSVHFFATPHSGASLLDKVAKSLKTKSEHEMLHYMKVLNKEKSRVNEAFHRLRDSASDYLRISKFTTHAILAGSATNMGEFGRSVMVVEEGTARLDIDEFYTYSKADHFQVCQPEDTYSSPFKTLAQEIRDMVLEKPKAQKESDNEQPVNPLEIREKRKAFLELVYATSTMQGSRSTSGISHNEFDDD